MEQTGLRAEGHAAGTGGGALRHAAWLFKGDGLKDVAQLAYAIGKATVGTKKSKQKARSDFVKGAKSSFK